MDSGKSDSTAETKVTEVEGSVAQESCNTANATEASNNDELLDQIQVPPLAPEERIVSAVSCNGGISYTTVAPSELGAVPEEDEEAATSSTPSTVVSYLSQYILIFVEEQEDRGDEVIRAKREMAMQRISHDITCFV